MIVFSAMMPHPPMSIPGIGSPDDFKDIPATLEAFEKLRIELENADPDTIVIISPHAHLEPYAFIVNSESDLRGDLSKFGLEDIYEFKNNIEIADKIDYACLMNEIPCLLRSELLDYGSLIPLFYLTKNIKPKIVHLSFSLMTYERHYRYGEIIQKVIDSDDTQRVAVIASGDLSHRLTTNAPIDFSPNAKDFDHSVMRFLGSNDLASLMGMDPEMIKDASECGLRSFIVLLGILHEKKYKFELLSYEAPFGIGYMTARLL
jgi:aromatic ring-opening dioxygenase LigB subunit